MPDIIYGHMIGVGIVVAVSDTGNDAELFAVLLREFTAQALSRRGQHAVVVVVALAEVVDTLTHVSYYLQAQLLTLLALTVVFARQCYQTLGPSDEADAQRALVDDALDGT